MLCCRDRSPGGCRAGRAVRGGAASDGHGSRPRLLPRRSLMRRIAAQSKCARMPSGRGLRFLVSQATGAAAIALLATTATAASERMSAPLASPQPSLPRATTDRPDGVSAPQVHLVYAVPADGADRGLDTNGVIAGTVNVWETWLAGQTGGRILRLDTYHGAPDITFVRLPQTDAQLAAAGPYVRDKIEADLKANGLIVPGNGKIYAVYYDGASTRSCGGGAWPPVLPGRVAALYLHGAPPDAPPCDTNQFHSPGQAPGYLDFAMLHELLHTLGFVPSCAPHFTRAGHVSDSPTDLMYAGPLPWNPTTLDVGHDDYFDANVPGCQDLSQSPYLTMKVSVDVTEAGRGTVTSDPAGISCPATCTATLWSPVTLSASPAAGETFTGWNGSCSGTGTCTLTDNGNVTADFAATVHQRSLTLRIHAHRATGSLRVHDGYRLCRSRVTVIIKRRRSGAWSTVRRALTNRAGYFAVSIPGGRAKYRALAPAATVNGAHCARATSSTITTKSH